MSKATLVLMLVAINAAMAPANARQQQRPVHEEKFEVLESAPPASLDEMGQQSLAIAVATYLGDVTPNDSPGHGMRRHQFRLVRLVKDVTGKLPAVGTSFDLLLHGGRAERSNEITVYKIVDVESLKDGQRYLLFLSVNSKTNELMPAFGTGSVFHVIGSKLRGLRKFGSALDGLEISAVLGKLSR